MTKEVKVPLPEGGRTVKKPLKPGCPLRATDKFLWSIQFSLSTRPSARDLGGGHSRPEALTHALGRCSSR
jgi:hypothetical protein